MAPCGHRLNESFVHCIEDERMNDYLGTVIPGTKDYLEINHNIIS